MHHTESKKRARSLWEFPRTAVGMEYYTWAHSVPVAIAHAAAVQNITGLESKKHTVSFKTVSQGMREVESVTAG